MLVRFFVIAFVLAWALTVPIALHVQGFIPTRVLPPAAQWLIGIVPIVAAWWVTRGSAERAPWIENSFRLRVAPVWYAIAIGAPWLIFAVAMMARTATGQALPTLSFSPLLAVFGAIWLVLALGEEAGWRSFALPHMLRTRGFFVAATLLGLVWCVWHYPKLMSGPYFKLNAGSFAMLGLFSLQIVIANYLICWLYVRTRSAILTSIFHASWNVVSTAYFMAAVDLYITGTLLVAVVAVLTLDRQWLTRADLPDTRRAAAS